MHIVQIQGVTFYGNAQQNLFHSCLLWIFFFVGAGGGF